jgi:hypothetical protein
MSQSEEFAYKNNTLPDLLYKDEEEYLYTLQSIMTPEPSETDQVNLEHAWDYYQGVMGQHPDLKKEQFGLYYKLFFAKGLSRGNLEAFTIALNDFVHAHRIEFGYQERTSTQDIDRSLSPDNVRELEKTYQKKIAEFREIYEAREKKAESLQTLPMELIKTPEKVLRMFRTYPYKKTGYDILEFFNQAKVTHTIPYLNIGEFYKIHNDVTIYPSWAEQHYPDQIIGYVKTDSAIVAKETSYSSFFLGEDTLTVKSTEEEVLNKLSGTQTIDKIKTLFLEQIDIPKVQIEEKMEESEIPYQVVKEDLRVECFFVNTDIHPLLFKHFLYTDPVIRNFFFLDERIKVGRKKNYLYIFYYPDPSSDDKNPITINLSNFFPNESLARQKQIPANQCHIRAYLSFVNRDTITQAVSDLNRCLTRFQTRRESIERELLEIVTGAYLNDEYKKECNIGVKIPEEQSVIPYNKLFGENSRSVRPAPIVTKKITRDKYYLVNPNDTENPSEWANQAPFENGDARIQAIWFPSVADKTRIEQSGKEVVSYFFTAEIGSDKPFIGLTKKTELDPPYMPITFKENQLDKGNSELSNYLKSEVSVSSSSSYIIITGKHVKFEKIGEMMSLVDSWMALSHPSENLYRYGLFNYEDSNDKSFVIPREKRSSNILYLLEYIVNGKKVQDSSLTNLRSSMRKYLKETTQYYSETFKYSREELVDIIIEPEKWLDPLLFYNILREMYKVELVFFVKDQEKSKSPFYLTTPYFHHDYSAETATRYKNFIMIAINNGGEFDSHDYPHCEPIFIYSKRAEDKKITPSYTVQRESLLHSIDLPLYRTVEKTLKELYGKKSGIPRMVGIPSKQTLDAFGRTEWLHFNNNVSVHLMVPIHSTGLPLYLDPIHGCSSEQAVEFIRQQGWRSTERTVQGKLLGYDVVNQGVRFFIPVEKGADASLLQTYQTYEKIARYLSEYVYYLFSLYLVGKEVREENRTEYYQYFSDHYLVISQDVQYPMIDRAFHIEGNPYLVNVEGVYKLKMSNLTLKRKCMYLLRRFYETQPEIVRLYHTLKYMPNYFRTILDFTPQQRTILLQQKKNVESYIQEVHRDLQEGSTELKPFATEKYMMYYLISELRHSVFLVQPARSVKHAAHLCEQWRLHKVVDKTMEEANLPCVLFTWDSPTSYKIYIQPGGEQRLVFIIPTEEGIRYQACLMYDVNYAK